MRKYTEKTELVSFHTQNLSHKREISKQQQRKRERESEQEGGRERETTTMKEKWLWSQG